MDLTISEKIRALSRRKGVTLSELANRTGQTRQNLNAKLNRNSFIQSDLERIAAALGCSVAVVFTDLHTGEQL